MITELHKPLIAFYIHTQEPALCGTYALSASWWRKKVKLEKIFAVCWEEILWAAGFVVSLNTSVLESSVNNSDGELS